MNIGIASFSNCRVMYQPWALASSMVLLIMPTEQTVIVVLPFDNMSAEAGQDYLAEWNRGGITAALSCIRSFFVIARSSAFTYKGRAINARDVGKELGVALFARG